MGIVRVYFPFRLFVVPFVLILVLCPCPPSRRRTIPHIRARREERSENHKPPSQQTRTRKHQELKAPVPYIFPLFFILSLAVSRLLPWRERRGGGGEEKQKSKIKGRGVNKEKRKRIPANVDDVGCLCVCL